MPHTKGPWELISFGRPVDAMMGSRFAIRAKSAPGGIAHTIGGLGDEEEANARLMAAAPDLVAALKNFDPGESLHVTHDADTVSCTICAARRALAKAGI